DDEGLAFGGAWRQPRTAVEPSADVRMLERGKNLPLAAKALLSGRVLRAPPQHLDRDGFLELVVVSHRLVDGAHAALTHSAEQAVLADDEAHPSVGDFGYR